MGKHRDETGKIDEVRHCFGFAAIHIDRVTESLKSVEADAKREHDLERGVPLHRRQPKGLDKPVVSVDAKGEVFKKTERG